MNFPFGFRALIICCFLSFGLTLGKPIESLSIDDLNKNLHNLPHSNYHGLLYLALGAASSGKSVFKTPSSLNDNCIRTSAVMMQAFEKPTTLWAAMIFLNSEVEEVLKHRNTSTFDNLVSMLCDKLSDEATQNLYFRDFDERKKAVEIPRPTKNFVLDIPSNQNLTAWILEASLLLDDPEIAKLYIMASFMSYQVSNLFNTSQEESSGILKAIENMYAGNRNNIATKDEVFVEALNDYANSLVTRGISIKDDEQMKPYVIEFLKKVDQYYLRNDLLKDEYSKIRAENGLKN